MSGHSRMGPGQSIARQKRSPACAGLTSRITGAEPTRLSKHPIYLNAPVLCVMPTISADNEIILCFRCDEVREHR